MPISRRQIPALIFAIIAAIAVIAAILLIHKLKSRSEESQPAATETAEKPLPDHRADSISLVVNGKHVDATDNNDAETPEELIGRITEIMLQANDTGDLQPFIDFIGPSNLTPPQIKNLRQRATASRLKLKEDQPFSTIEGKENQWSLNLVDEKAITLSLQQKTNGLWAIKDITLPSLADTKTITPILPKIDQKAVQKAVATDQAAATVRSFINAIINLDPSTAGTFIDKGKVSYATLAGLCILFEEGHYQLVKEKAVRNMFLGNNAAGWIVRVENPAAVKPAMFALSTKRKSSEADWKITEINLDKLLTNYATQLIGGDAHYIPLIKNPQGGDSIVLYFQLDSKELTKRTQRQLKIIANLLKSAPAKKLTISGHTDATGSDDYNLNLSNLRAKQTMSFLATQGLDSGQMEIVSFGKSKPRQPNTTDDGRRANRRAEILLDF